MISRLTILACLLFCAFSMSAQKPENITSERSTNSMAALEMMCDQQDAGTISSITAITAQSNQIGLGDVTFLCVGDEISVDHANDFNLLDDPTPSTPPGIGYVFYDCAPSATGPALSLVQDDPCTNTRSTIYDFATDRIVNQTNGVWLAAGNMNGDVDFINDGNLSRSFAGSNQSKEFWFAPITLDDFASRGFFVDPGTGELGPCVNLRADQAFQVVYLAPIEAGQVEISENDGCVATFGVSGGLPEYDNSDYTISITKVGSSSVTGQVTTGAASHRSMVSFTVPEQGTYQITIEDGKSCSSSFRVDLIGCDGIASNAGSDVVAPGDRVCVDVVVNDFVGISSVQYTIEWDETILQFDGVEATTPPVPGLDVNGSFGTTFSNDGMITFSWNSPNFQTGTTLPDGTVFYRICFIALGQVGDFSTVEFNSELTPVQISNSNGDLIGMDLSAVGIVTITNSAIDLQFEVDTACHSASDGGLRIFPIGGTPPYDITYRLTPGGMAINGQVNASGGFLDGTMLPAGTYSVTVEDSSTPQETLTTTVDLIERVELAVNIDPIQQITCFGETDGILIARVFEDGVEVMNPGTEYEYLWNFQNQRTRVISDLPSRLYAVTLTDGFGCEAETNRRLDTPPGVTIDATITPASCSGVDDGGMTFDVMGGTAPTSNYTIDITGPGSFTLNQTGDRVNINTGLIAGRYDITIDDENSCSLDTFLIVGAAKELSLNISILDQPMCNGAADGQIFVNGITNGGPAATPYTFTWISNPPVGAGNTTNTPTSSNIQNLRAGSYRLRLSDTDGCEIDTTFMIGQPDDLTITLVDKQNESCVGNDGSAEVSVSGGTEISGYTYDWGVAGQTTNVAVGLPAGNYELTVTDDNRCMAMLPFNIAAATPPQITELRNDTLDCSTDLSGALTVVAIDGSSPIDAYRWSETLNGPAIQTGPMATTLRPGTYYVTITDDVGCTTVDSAEVYAPEDIFLEDFLVISPTCPGDPNGTIILTIEGGTEPYSIFWSNAPASPGGSVLAGVEAGVYGVTVTDANGCMPNIDTVFTLEDPPSITIDFDILENVSCFGSTCDGSVMASAAFDDGSAGTFDFTWASGETDTGVFESTATMLCQGGQTVSVTDGVCPPEVALVEVPVNDPLTVMASSTPVSCFGRSDGTAEIQPMGGEGPYRYQWLPPLNSNGPNVTGLAADTFFVDILDANDCPFSTSVIVTEPDEFTADIDLLNTFDVTCPAGDDAQIAVTIMGGNQTNVTYTWTPGVTLGNSPIATDLTSGDYRIDVEDGRGCTTSVTHSISEPPPITFSLDDIPEIECFGFTTTITIDDVQGGNGPSYAYSVDEAPNQDITFGTNVFSGPHRIEIFDSRNCVIDTTINITQPNPVTINIDPVIEVELGDSLTLRPIYNPGGVPINQDSIFWEPPLYLSCDRCPNPIVRPFEDQNYFITVYDENGCLGEAEVLIEVDKNRNIFLPNAFSPNGDGVNDEFRVFTGVGVQKVNYVKIFDRWGGLMYAAEDLDPDISGIVTWDGFYKGDKVDTGVFVYLVEVEFEDDITLLYRGDLTLIR